MSVEKRFRRCVDPCQRCLTLDDTHDLCVMCLGEEHARSVLEGMEFIVGTIHLLIVSLFSVGKSSALGCPFFSRELGRSSAPPAARVQPLLRQ